MLIASPPSLSDGSMDSDIMLEGGMALKTEPPTVFETLSLAPSSLPHLLFSLSSLSVATSEADGTAPRLKWRRRSNATRHEILFLRFLRLPVDRSPSPPSESKRQGRRYPALSPRTSEQRPAGAFIKACGSEAKSRSLRSNFLRRMRCCSQHASSLRLFVGSQ